MSRIVVNELEAKQDLDQQEMQAITGGTSGLGLGMGMANTLMMRQIASSLPVSPQGGGCHPDDSGSSGGDDTCNSNHNDVKYPQ